ncbi:MAG: M28 family peptidase [Gemmatimonas sp.]
MPSRHSGLTRHALAIAALLVSACRPPAPLGPMPEGIKADIEVIGSAQQEGRATGTPGSHRAAMYIARHYQSLRVPPAFPGKCTASVTLCGIGYMQQFRLRVAGQAQNVGAVIMGTDSTVRDQYIVVGAHYDHIGRNPNLSLDPEREDAIRPGADDNASGTAAVMELARRLKANPARRSVLFLHFDAEELGLHGSTAFLRNPPVPRQSMRFMLNMDMVGRLKGGPLQIDKSTLMYEDKGLEHVIDSATRAVGVGHKFTRDIDGRSDHAPFRLQDVSAIALFTGFHGDYHSARDVISRLDIRGIGKVVDIAEAIVRFEADR